MDKLTRDGASLIFMGVVCIAVATLLMYGLVGRQYYVDIDTVAIMQALTGTDIVKSLFISVIAPPIIGAAGLALIMIGWRL